MMQELFGGLQGKSVLIHLKVFPLGGMSLTITPEEKVLREFDENDQDDANDLLPIENGSLKSHIEMGQMGRTSSLKKHQH